MTGKSVARKSAPSEGSGLRGAQRRFTRRRFVEAATEVFEEKGYVDTTVEDILERTGASRATFYMYYPNKAQILLDALTEYRQSYELLVNDFKKLIEPTVEDLEAWFGSYVDLYSANRPLLAALHQAEVVEPEFHGRTMQDVHDYLEMWEKAGVLETGDEPREDLEIRCVLLFAQVQRFMYLWQTQQLNINRAKAIRAIAAAWYDVMRGSGASRRALLASNGADQAG